MIAADYCYTLQETVKHCEDGDKSAGQYGLLPSLILCPNSLIEHWAFELTKFIPKNCLHPILYKGKTPADRRKILYRVQENRKNLSAISSGQVLIASYDSIRNDLTQVLDSGIEFNYCVLDEGHVMKNERSKISQSVRKIRAQHRLILTGTPIQNSIVDLWALFDYLMPGYLGTDKHFQKRFVKPILQSKASLLEAPSHEDIQHSEIAPSDASSSAGILALESLHRQVLPFIMRRMKETVLKELPPKIIQDYFCELTPIQVYLHVHF